MVDPISAVITDYLEGHSSLDQAARELVSIYRETGWQFNISGDADRQSDEFKQLLVLHERWLELDRTQPPDQ